MFPRPTLELFDAWLAQRQLRLDAVIVGGSALALLGVISRPTRDVDILHPELTEEITRAAREFAEHMRAEGTELGDDWLNNGPSQLMECLPPGWRLRVQNAFKGAALNLVTLGPADLLKTKLFALCDRGTDLNDCIALNPTAAELADAQSWVTERDANPLWPDHVRAVFADLHRRLGHGV